MTKYFNFTNAFVVIAILFFLSAKGQSGLLSKKANSFQTLTEIWELEPDTQKGTFFLSKYKPIYVLPFRYTIKPNELPYNSGTEVVSDKYVHIDDLETKFQLSFKVKLAQDIIFGKADLWMAYSQKSFWQIYNAEFSRPFRETNYEPEVILSLPSNFKIFGLDGKMFGVSFNHQSNGRTQTLTRSWNRIIGFAAFEKKNCSFIVRAWYAFQINENPDIKDYTGRADATLVYLLNKNIITIHGQHSLRTGPLNHGQIQVDWGFPIKGNLRGHFQFFDGYGDTMIDYNYK
ncbi:phospholipase A [Flavobacterium sp.]|uniref:phospholipase A n=1 Tax=Flavobacterium sp. TaxID=239 RepID=UPI003752A8C5